MKIEPTFRLFLVAIASLTSTSFVSPVPPMLSPLVIVMAVSFICTGSVVPRNETGRLKVVVAALSDELELPPLWKRGPLAPMVTGELKDVVVCADASDDSPPNRPNDGVDEPVVDCRSVSVEVTPVTLLMDLSLSSAVVVSALLVWLPGVKPAGDMLMVLPSELLTLAILLSTAFCAMSIVSARPILRPKIMTIDAVRTPLRNALRNPREIGFIQYSLLRISSTPRLYSHNLQTGTKFCGQLLSSAKQAIIRLC